MWSNATFLCPLVSFLGPHELLGLAQCNKQIRLHLQSLFRRWKRIRAHVALGVWLVQHVQVRFASYAQVLERRHVSRSETNDPRVPPRVVTVWIEQGQVPNSEIVWNPSTLPIVLANGTMLHFAHDSQSTTNMPMMTNVVQRHRRIYTRMTLEVFRSNEVRVLRKWTYIKEFGEFVAPTAPSKRLYDGAGAMCRYDLLSVDGNVAMELEVPTGAGDVAVDYYLVCKALIAIHLNELLQHFVESIRPMAPLPTARSPPVDGVLAIEFRALNGAIVHPAQRLFVRIAVEQEESAQAHRASRRITIGMEQFQIITVTKRPADTIQKLQLPRTPGYLWFRIQTAARHDLFAGVLLHQGARTTSDQDDTKKHILQAEWVPSVLEYDPTPQSIVRRNLIGRFHLATIHETNLVECQVLAQWLPTARLAPYAARIESSTRSIIHSHAR